MQQIVIKIWKWREFGVQASLCSLIWPVSVWIRLVVLPIQGLLYPIRQVIPLLFHHHSYPPYYYHLSPLSLFFVYNSIIITKFKVKSSLSISPCYNLEFTLSTAYTSCRIQYPPHNVSLLFIVTMTSWLQDGASARSLPPYMIDCPQPARHNSWNVQSPCHIPKVGSYIIGIYILISTSKAAHWQPPSHSSISPEYGLHVHLPSHPIRNLECISKFTWLLPSTVFPNSLNYSLQVYLIMAFQVQLQTCSIRASKCITKFTW